MTSVLQHSRTPSTGTLFSRLTIPNLRFAMPQAPTERTRLRSIFRTAIREGDGKVASLCQVAQSVLYASTACFWKVELTTSKV
jgi:hypothetical protein